MHLFAILCPPYLAYHPIPLLCEILALLKLTKFPLTSRGNGGHDFPVRLRHLQYSMSLPLYPQTKSKTLFKVWLLPSTSPDTKGTSRQTLPFTKSTLWPLTAMAFLDLPGTLTCGIFAKSWWSCKYLTAVRVCRWLSEAAQQRNTNFIAVSPPVTRIPSLKGKEGSATGLFKVAVKSRLSETGEADGQC